jgi:hypothetical protein
MMRLNDFATTRPRATVVALAAAASSMLAVTACGASTPVLTNGKAVPPEFRAACGHPGAQVSVRRVPVTVRHADCDLTGVGLSYRDHGGAYVPRQPGTISNSGGFSLTVHPGTLDVTVHAPKGPAGNA